VAAARTIRTFSPPLASKNHSAAAVNRFVGSADRAVDGLKSLSGLPLRQLILMPKVNEGDEIGRAAYSRNFRGEFRSGQSHLAAAWEIAGKGACPGPF
jgi:hypothetical protein